MSEPFRIFTNGHVVLADRVVEADIVTRAGRIVALGSSNFVDNFHALHHLAEDGIGAIQGGVPSLFQVGFPLLGSVLNAILLLDLVQHRLVKFLSGYNIELGTGGLALRVDLVS